MFEKMLKKPHSSARNADEEAVLKEKQSLPFIFFLVLIAVLPILYVPSFAGSLLNLKMFFVYVMVTIFLVMLLSRAFNARQVVLPKSLLTLGLLLVPLTYILAGALSKNRGISFFGRDLAQDSVFAIVALCIVVVISAVLCVRKRHVIYLYSALLLAGAVSGILHVINIAAPVVFPTVTALHIFPFNTVTTLGKWNDLGLFSALIVMLAVAALQYLDSTTNIKRFLYTTAIVNTLLVIIVNMNLAWWILGIFALGIIISSAVNVGGKTKKKLPIFALVTLILSISFLFFGNTLGNTIAQKFAINHIEARPSVETTFSVAQKALSGERVFVGSGPALFEVEWQKHRPVDGENSLLMTNFWNLDFRYGSGFIPSFLVTTGLFGFAAWAFLFILILINSIRLILKKKRDERETFVAVATSTITVALWVIAILYLPSTTLVVFMFIMTGVLIAQLIESKTIPTFSYSLKVKKRAMIANTAVLLLLLVVILGAFKVTTKFVAYVYFQQAVVALQQAGDLDVAERLLSRSVALDAIDTYYRSLAEVGTLQIQELLVRADMGEEVTPDVFWEIVNSVVANYQAAIAYDANNYHNYVGIGSFYAGLAAIGVEGVYEPAKDLFAQALRIKPNNPEIYLAVARLELANQNDFFAARVAIDQALEIKPNFTDAILFKVQLDIAQNRIEQAIDVLRRAGATNQNDPIIYFQLGLLLFETEEYVEAVLALERAIRLNPGLQNARFFLGLSQYELGETQSALQHFRILWQQNPQNEELMEIISNLEQGRSPVFDGGDTSLDTLNQLPLEDVLDDNNVETDDLTEGE